MLRGWAQQHNERTGINELEYRVMEITQSKQQRENRLERKKGIAQETCGTITKDVTSLSLESWKERKKSVG